MSIWIISQNSDKESVAQSLSGSCSHILLYSSLIEVYNLIQDSNHQHIIMYDIDQLTLDDKNLLEGLTREGRGRIIYFSSRSSCFNKPFGTSLLPVLQYADLKLNLANLDLLIEPNSDPVRLSANEAKTLAVFMRKPAEKISRKELTDQVWGFTKVGSRTLDSQISRLRRRIEGSDVDIESIYGGGYIMRK